MVHGLEKFKEYFHGCTKQYVFIGGTACDILLEEAGFSFRATKDLDIVLIIEALDPSFGKIFWKFIEDGGYKNREKGTGISQFYRFAQPRNRFFPKMIELFSKHPENISLVFETGLTPIHIDESVVSLSAILLNDAYYEVLIKGFRTIDGYSVIGIEALILFKIKAWLDMKERKAAGEEIDSKNIKKHKNDVFRLLANIVPSSRMETAEEIQFDIGKFIELIAEDKPDLKNLGIKNTTHDELMKILGAIYF